MYWPIIPSLSPRPAGQASKTLSEVEGNGGRRVRQDPVATGIIQEVTDRMSKLRIWVWSAVIVASTLAGCFFYFLRIKPAGQEWSTLDSVLVTPIAFPGGLLILAFMPNVHTWGPWANWISFGISWAFYTALLAWVLTLWFRWRGR